MNDPRLQRPGRALTIAGSDSGGGAGIQADLKTFSALGVFGASAITAVTAQNTKAVTAVMPLSTDLIAAQIKAVLDDIGADAVKLGMLFSPEIIETVADALDGCVAPIVLDPVMVAKSGDRLLQDDAIMALVRYLFPVATLVTPNLPEAETLSGILIRDDASIREAALRIMSLGASNVLIKGGHMPGETTTDTLFMSGGSVTGSGGAGASANALTVHTFTQPRIDTPNTHGTGCTYSSAIAAFLARGETLASAIGLANQYLHDAIRAGAGRRIGSGHGPVHHFHAWH
jgi:hydroxymethylpyrimidine/phosphomethylpyrimidine kinase